jgi:hypothetical protein
VANYTIRKSPFYLKGIYKMEYNKIMIDFAMFCKNQDNFDEAVFNLKTLLIDDEFKHETDESVIEFMLADFNKNTKIPIKSYIN